MGEIKAAAPVKLIAGEIFGSEELIRSAENRLTGLFGRIDLASETIPFDFTDYYNAEMGAGLFRRWISFRRLVSPEELSDVKNQTNDIEVQVSGGNKRSINIDPGYISAPNLILASTKNYSHRIYLQKGIFAELTYIYQNGNFDFMPWTYPDYKSKTATEFFKKVRDIYLKQITWKSG